MARTILSLFVTLALVSGGTLAESPAVKSAMVNDTDSPISNKARVQ